MSRQYRVFNRKMFSLMVEVSSKKELKEKKELYRRRGFYVRVVRTRDKYLIYIRDRHKIRH